LNSLSQNAQQNLNSNGNSKTRENKSHNISNNKVSTNKASRYNQLIGSWNPALLYQTHQTLPNKAKFSDPTSPKESNQIQLLRKKWIIKKDIDPSCAYKLNQSLKLTSSKKGDRKKKGSSKRSNSKSKNNSGTRSLSKYTIPQTTRKEQFPFEYKLNHKSSDKTYRKELKKPGVPSSKISSWAEMIGNGVNSEMSSNIYRTKENHDTNNGCKKSKSWRRSGSNKRKRKKHHLSIGQHCESNTIDNTNQNTFATQLISLIQQLHSPSGEKSHNHSQSEVYNQNIKSIVHSKSGQHYKAKSKSSMHSRSNTTENPHKIKRLNQFSKANNFIKAHGKK